MTNNKALLKNKNLFTFLKDKLNKHKLMPPPSLDASDSDAEEDGASITSEDSQTTTDAKQQTSNQEQIILTELQRKAKKAGSKASIIYRIFVKNTNNSLVLKNAEEAQVEFSKLTPDQRNKVKNPNSLKELINNSFKKNKVLSPRGNKLSQIRGLQNLLEENFSTQTDLQETNRQQPPSLDQSSSSEELIVSVSDDRSQKFTATIDVASAKSNRLVQRISAPPSAESTSSRPRRAPRVKQREETQVISVKTQRQQNSENNPMLQLRTQLAAAEKRAAAAEQAQKEAEKEPLPQSKRRKKKQEKEPLPHQKKRRK